MRTKIATLSAIVLGLVLSNAAQALPIKNNIVDGFKTAWMPSNLRSCAVTCRVAGGTPEREDMVIPALGLKSTYDCKGKVAVGAPTPGGGYVFGNNFDSPNYAPYCMVSLPNGTVQRLTSFYCLCVW